MANNIIIDGSNIAFIACHRGKNRENGPAQEFFKFIDQLSVRFPDYGITVVWDGRAQWRYDLHPEYKGKRERTFNQKISREQAKCLIHLLQDTLSFFGVTQLLAPTLEADDFASVLASNSSKEKGDKTLLISRDDDWKQIVLLSDHSVWIMDPVKDEILSRTQIEEATGLNALLYVQHKALVGDSSDNIPGVKGVGTKAADVLVQLAKDANHIGYPDIAALQFGFALDVSESEFKKLPKPVRTFLQDMHNDEDSYWEWKKYCKVISLNPDQYPEGFDYSKWDKVDDPETKRLIISKLNIPTLRKQ